jgi:hypothetical protein
VTISEVRRVEHQLDAQEERDRVALPHHAEDADREEERAEDEVTFEDRDSDMSGLRISVHLQDDLVAVLVLFAGHDDRADDGDEQAARRSGRRGATQLRDERRRQRR